MGVKLSQMLDLLATTTENLPVNQLAWTLPYQNYRVIGSWFGPDKIELSGGTSIKRKTVLDETGQAYHTLPMTRRSVNVAQFVSTMTAEWVLAEAYWVLSEDEDNLNTSGQSAHSFSKALLNLQRERRTRALLDLFKVLAQRAWLVPSTDSDNIYPLGVPYAIPKLAAGQSATAAGFYGGRYDSNMGANTFGIPPATSGDNTVDITGGKPMWRSYCAGYVNVNATFFDTLNKAMMMTNFESPVMKGERLIDSTVNNRRFYANADTIVAIGRWVRDNNDSIGPDSGKFAGHQVWNGIPFIHEPQLDSTGSGEPGQYNPVYGINHNQWKVFVQSDDYFRESDPFRETETPRMATFFIYLKYCYLCMNRREQFCINQVA